MLPSSFKRNLIGSSNPPSRVVKNQTGLPLVSLCYFHLKCLFPLFQQHACKVTKLSACKAMCMTTISKTHIGFYNTTLNVCVFCRLFSNKIDTAFILYLSSVFQFVFFSFKPQWIYHSGIQYSHHRYRDKAKKKEAGGTVCLGQPRFRPEFHAEIGFLIKTDCEEQRTDKNGCGNP